MTSIGIASLWWNHQELLPEFVRMMKVGGWDKLILIDDASTEEANMAYRGAAAELGSAASVLRMDRNDALPAANAGMAALGTDIVIGMANDVVMTDEHWLEWGIEGMDRGIIQGPNCFFRGILYIDGCMAVMMREDWELLGGLDTEHYSHPGYWSDADFCLRAQRKGMTVRPTRSGIRHLVNYSGANRLPECRVSNRKNCEELIARYLESITLQIPIVFRDGAGAQ